MTLTPSTIIFVGIGLFVAISAIVSIFKDMKAFHKSCKQFKESRKEYKRLMAQMNKRIEERNRAMGRIEDPLQRLLYSLEHTPSSYLGKVPDTPQTIAWQERWCRP